MAVLIIGGSGMLKAASSWLAAQRKTPILLCGRRRQRYADILKQHAHALFVALDFSCLQDWQALAQKIKDYEVTEILCWVHSSYDGLLLAFLETLTGEARCVLVLVRGSHAAVPVITDPRYDLCVVRLGWHSEAQRWLTHEEISDAALLALQQRCNVDVGELL